MSKFIDATYAPPLRAPEIKEGTAMGAYRGGSDSGLWIGLGALAAGAFLLYKLVKRP